ncbi:MULTISPECIES: hypothetical protein [Methylobacterium]|uniref:hypothetical protein n=1 Tax=Methylobacterium TaxID=407 RepID=UPI0013DC5490|nr:MULTISPECIES: hypothetical protein [Methylobacterium]
MSVMTASGVWHSTVYELRRLIVVLALRVIIAVVPREDRRTIQAVGVMLEAFKADHRS